MDCSHYLQVHLPQYVPDTLLSAGKDSQPGEVTSSMQQDIAPHLQLELRRASAHKTLQELAISRQPDIISVWLCLPFNSNTVILSLPSMPVISQLMDK